MSAAQHLQPMQLQMFMPAGQVKNLPEPPHDADAFQGNAGFMWQLKRHESTKPGSANDTWAPRGDGPSLRESIAQHGVQSPVNLYHNEGRGPHLTQGHHRVATADDLDPTMELPIRHVGDPEVTQRHWRKDFVTGEWKAYPL